MYHIHSSNDDFSKSLGAFLNDCSSKAIEDHGFFTIAFSGGSAATKVCECYDRTDVSCAVDFSKWKIFFCDERFVSLDHSDSNFKTINDGLLKKHPQFINENIFMLNKCGGVADAAKDYGAKLRSIFPNKTLPEFDLIILGMGPDGHICSLFPNHKLLDEKLKWIGSVDDSPKPPPQRITFTLDVVNSAKTIAFITLGESKASNIHKAIECEPTREIPASLVKPTNGSVHWFMDMAASSLLKL